MTFKLYDCDVGLTIRGVNYDFTHVDSVVVEDPERTRLVRGANAGNKTGISYKEGVKEPKTFTIATMEIPAELHGLLKEVYASQERIDAYVVARSDGSHKIAKQAVLSQEPQQLTLDETPESMNVSLELQSFDVKEVHKS